MATYAFETADEIAACEECPLSGYEIDLSKGRDFELWCDLLGREVASDSMDDFGRFVDCPLMRLDEVDDEPDLKCPLSDIDMQCPTLTRDRARLMRSNKCANHWRGIASLYMQMPRDMDAEDVVRALLVGEIGAMEAIRRIEEL